MLLDNADLIQDMGATFCGSGKRTVQKRGEVSNNNKKQFWHEYLTARNFADTMDYGLGPAMRGYMLCAGDEKTEPYQCSSLITAKLLQYQKENTYFKYSTTDKPRRHSGGKPLLIGQQAGSTGSQANSYGIPKTIPKTKTVESKPAQVSSCKSIDTTATGEQEAISVDNDPILWHPALKSPPDLEFTASESMDVTDFQEELLLQSEELPLPDLGSMDLMEMLEM